MKIRKLSLGPIRDEKQCLDARSPGQDNMLTSTVIGTVELKAFICPTCEARRSWDWTEVTEQTVVVVCLNCRTHYTIRGELIDALLANTDCVLPPHAEG
jgi:hypothetical protein